MITRLLVWFLFSSVFIVLVAMNISTAISETWDIQNETMIRFRHNFYGAFDVFGLLWAVTGKNPFKIIHEAMRDVSGDE